jgi:uncharacterized protein (DUF983 family)
MRETHIFEHYAPPQDRCSICGRQTGPFSVEGRFTGRDFALQHWPLCEACRKDLRRQRADQDPWIAQRYVIFLRWLSGCYYRPLGGNQASRILPKKPA